MPTNPADIYIYFTRENILEITLSDYKEYDYVKIGRLDRFGEWHHSDNSGKMQLIFNDIPIDIHEKIKTVCSSHLGEFIQPFKMSIDGDSIYFCGEIIDYSIKDNIHIINMY